MAIVVIMLTVSLSFVSFNANSEDVPGPFADRSSGYPLASDVLNQEQTWNDDAYGITLSDWYSQTFIPSTSGPLSKVSVYIWNVFGTGDLNCEIWTTDASHHPLAKLTGEIIADGTIPGSYDDWYDIEFSTPETLSSGIEYTIVMWCTGDIEYDWRCWGASDNYPFGDGYGSWNSGASWDPALGKDFCFKTYMDNGLEGLKKVAWHPNGKYAYAVAGDEMVWEYDREATSWSIFGSPNLNMEFNDIVYDPTYGLFWLVGQDTSTSFPRAYSFDGTSFFDETSYPTMGTFNSVAPAAGIGGCYFLAVGVDSGGQPLAVWRDTGGWTAVTGGWSGNPEELKAVTWNYNPGASNNHYAVGIDNNGFGFVYSFLAGGTFTLLEYNTDSSGTKLEPGESISWNPQAGLGAEYDYALIGSSQRDNVGNAYKYTGASNPILISPDTVPIYDIDWHPDGELAVLVGGQAGSGIVYHHSYGTSCVVDLTSDMPGSPDMFYGVAVKGPSSPSSAIILGASGGYADYVEASNIDTQITVNAAYPNIYWVGFNDTLHNSRIEQQVQPDDWYEFSFAANYSLGWSNCEVIVQAWYDNGAVGDASAYPSETDDNRCLAFTLYYDPSGGPFYTMTYPGIPEYAVGVPTDVIVPGGAVGEDIHYVTLEVRLGPQTRNASAGGFFSGDADYDVLKNNALLDAYSWDFNVTVRDSTNNAATNSMYSEFGIEKMVGISVTGNPTGNAPPGSEDIALSNPSVITYSSNADYWVNVSIPHVYENGNDLSPNWIPASNVNVSNSNVLSDTTYTDIDGATWPNGRPMQGPDLDWCVWGNSTAVQWMPAPANGTISFGTWGSDYNAAGFGWAATTQLDWWVTVPAATVEGIYWATITITIDSGA